jgi:hypothetical protein
MSDLTKAIKYLKPNAEFSFTDDDYSTVKWDLLDGDAPTKSEINAALKTIEANELANAETKAAAKAALFVRLGITADEAALLLE